MCVLKAAIFFDLLLFVKSDRTAAAQEDEKPYETSCAAVQQIVEFFVKSKDLKTLE